MNTRVSAWTGNMDVGCRLISLTENRNGRVCRRMICSKMTVSIVVNGT